MFKFLKKFYLNLTWLIYTYVYARIINWSIQCTLVFHDKKVRSVQKIKFENHWIYLRIAVDSRFAAQCN